MYHKNKNTRGLRYFGVTLVFAMGVLSTIGSNGGGGSGDGGSSNTPPVADAGVSYSGYESSPVTIQFDGSASFDPDGDPLSYSWDFGDGGTGTGISPSHDYTVSGTYTVTLTVDDGNSSNSASATVTITAVDVMCSSTVLDSVQTISGWNRIQSENSGSPIYYQETLTRETTGTGPAITMDYMVHDHGTPKALLVLIAGGQLNANISGTNGISPTFAGGNFLVRSAHLFAAQGYRVLTIDRPSDNQDYIQGSGSGYAYDGYRTSMEHAVDLSELINIVNTTNLPVIIAGTSRGSISAVAQHELGAALAISAPLTSGSFGTPIGTGNVLPANVTDPVHISWHELDGCSSTTPANAQALVSDFPDAMGVSIGGGFASVASASPCNADHYHGFPGIESCAVQQATNWLAAELMSLPATRPTTLPVADTTAINTPTSINLSGAATGAIPGALTYSLPHTTTSLGGTISIAGTSVNYTPPMNISGIVDTFVYIVDEAGGGTSHNVVAVTIMP